ncbi:MAG: type II toxin-antitoxin system VapC family toxin, partial [Acetobacteraceae bacterium]
MVVFDASILLFVFDENTPSSAPRAKERVEYLIDRLSEAGEKIIIPTPALSECLVHTGPAGAEYLTAISKQSCFRVASFDERAAVEAAVRTYNARQRGQRKGGNPDASKTKIKFDRQIAAIATVEGATAVYSDDSDVRGYAVEAGMEAYQLSDLPLPPENPQTAME